MANVLQVLRSSTAGKRPVGRLPGELYVNFTDMTFGYIDESGESVDVATAGGDAEGYLPLSGGTMDDLAGIYWGDGEETPRGMVRGTDTNGLSITAEGIGGDNSTALSLEQALVTLGIVTAADSNTITLDIDQTTFIKPPVYDPAPTEDGHLANKKYVDDLVATGGGEFVPLDGSVPMSGPLGIDAAGATSLRVNDTGGTANGIVGQVQGEDKWGIGVHGNGNIIVGTGPVNLDENHQLAINPDVHASFFADSEVGPGSGVWIYADGRVLLGSEPVEDMDATTKAYVDEAVINGGDGTYLPLAGGTMDDGSTIAWGDRLSIEDATGLKLSGTAGDATKYSGALFDNAGATLTAGDTTVGGADAFFRVGPDATTASKIISYSTTNTFTSNRQIVDKKYVDDAVAAGVGGLPADATGYLHNDGAGELSWDDVPVLPDVPDDSDGWTLSIDANGNVVWVPGGSDLPADAEGVLTNDGAGALTWEPMPALPDIPADSEGDVLTIDVDGNISWEPVPGADEYVKIDGTSVMTAPLQVKNNGHYGIVLDSETLAGGIVGKLSGVEKWGIGIHSNGNIGIGAGDVSQADNVDLSIRHKDHMSIFAGGEAGSTENGVWIHADGRVSLNSLDLQPMDATPKQYVDDAIAGGGLLPVIPDDSAGDVLTIDAEGNLIWAPSTGSDLPADAEGVLTNDGAGALSWVSLDDEYVRIDGTSTMTGKLVVDNPNGTGVDINGPADGYSGIVGKNGGMETWGIGRHNDGDIVIGSGSVSSADNNQLAINPGIHASFFADPEVGPGSGVWVYADGRVLLGSDPVEDMDAVTKQYLEANGGLPVIPDDSAGDVLTIDAEGNLIWAPVAGSVVFSDTPPENPTPGMQWYATTEDTGLYLYYDDGDSQQWVQANGGGGGGTDLPADAAGVLTNDGSGVLTWEASAGGGVDLAADYVWTGDHTFYSSDPTGDPDTDKYLLINSPTGDSPVLQGWVNGVQQGSVAFNTVGIKIRAQDDDTTLDASTYWTFRAGGDAVFQIYEYYVICRQALQLEVEPSQDNHATTKAYVDGGAAALSAEVDRKVAEGIAAFKAQLLDALNPDTDTQLSDID